MPFAASQAIPFLLGGGHAGGIVKDAEDVMQILRYNKLDPETQPVRELFLKRGTKELYEKIRKACRFE